MDIDYIMSITDKLQDLVTAKEDMKTALVEKGVTPTGGLSTYADCIRNIDGGGVIPPDTKFAYSKFIEAPSFPASEYKDMDYMFYGCKNLTTLPTRLSTDNVTSMSYMFARCDSLTNIPQMSTSNVTNMNCMFQYTTKGNRIERIPFMDCGKVECFEMFGSYSYEMVSVGYVEGFKDLGKSITKDYIAAAAYKNVSFERAYLSRESTVNIIDNLYDISTQNKSLTFQLNNYTINLLTDEDKAAAVRKGWTISS
jgi:hypothetical protein